MLGYNPPISTTTLPAGVWIWIARSGFPYGIVVPLFAPVPTHYLKIRRPLPGDLLDEYLPLPKGSLPSPDLSSAAHAAAKPAYSAPTCGPVCLSSCWSKLSGTPCYPGSSSLTPRRCHPGQRHPALRPPRPGRPELLSPHPRRLRRRSRRDFAREYLPLFAPSPNFGRGVGGEGWGQCLPNSNHLTPTPTNLSRLLPYRQRPPLLAPIPHHRHPLILIT